MLGKYCIPSSNAYFLLTEQHEIWWGKKTKSSIIPKVFIRKLLSVCPLGRWLHFWESAFCANWSEMWLSRVKLPQSVQNGLEALGSLPDGSYLVPNAVLSLAYFWEQVLSGTAHVGAVCPTGSPDCPFQPRVLPCHYWFYEASISFCKH